jgi:predicted negative regulator of RcsB-dependent stress response
LKDLITRLAVVGRDRLSDHDAKIAALINAQLASEERISKVAEAQLRLTEAQAQTDERLNALINLVERFITEKRNGRSKS